MLALLHGWNKLIISEFELSPALMLDDSHITVGGRELDPLRGGILALLVGLAVSGFGAYDYTQQSEAIENSVEVDATITGKSVESVTGGSATGTKFDPVVTFEYSYEGESYTGNDIYPSTTSKNYDTKSKAKSAIGEYEKGETVTAYVNPDSPSEAFLENEESSSPLLFAGVGVVFVLGGIFVLFRAFTGR